MYTIYSIIDSFANLSPEKINFRELEKKNFRGQLEEALSGIGLMSTFRSTTMCLVWLVNFGKGVGETDT